MAALAAVTEASLRIESSITPYSVLAPGMGALVFTLVHRDPVLVRDESDREITIIVAATELATGTAAQPDEEVVQLRSGQLLIGTRNNPPPGCTSDST